MTHAVVVLLAAADVFVVLPDVENVEVPLPIVVDVDVPVVVVRAPLELAAGVVLEPDAVPLTLTSSSTQLSEVPARTVTWPVKFCTLWAEARQESAGERRRRSVPSVCSRTSASQRSGQIRRARTIVDDKCQRRALGDVCGVRRQQARGGRARVAADTAQESEDWSSSASK